MQKLEYLEPKDLARVFRAFHETENQRHHMVALTCFFTSARISQVLALRGIDIFELGGKFVVKIGSAKRGHNGTYELYVHPDPAFDMSPLVEMAKRAGSSRIFGGLDRRYFDRVIKRCSERAGIHESYAHAHMLRHSAAMVIMMHSQRIGAVSQFLLHRSPSSAFPYLAENDGRYAQSAMDALQLS